VAARVQAALGCSGRNACQWLGFNRSTIRYKAKPVPDKKQLLEAEIVRVSKEHPTLGYRKVTGLMRSLGFHVNKKQVQRVRREEGLQVPPPKPKQRRQGLSTGLPQRAQHRNHVWAWDFVADYTQRGGKLRTFNLIDEYTRECHCIHADRAIKATDVLDLLREAIEHNGVPEVHPLRQRPRVHCQGHPEVAGRKRNQDPLHRSGMSLAERLCGEL
jgi:transposase InsO family protein